MNTSAGYKLMIFPVCIAEVVCFFLNKQLIYWGFISSCNSFGRWSHWPQGPKHGCAISRLLGLWV